LRFADARRGWTCGQAQGERRSRRRRTPSGLCEQELARLTDENDNLRGEVTRLTEVAARFNERLTALKNTVLASASAALREGESRVVLSALWDSTRQIDDREGTAKPPLRFGRFAEAEADAEAAEGEAAPEEDEEAQAEPARTPQTSKRRKAVDSDDSTKSRGTAKSP
jgi:hypothetical protein